jgi:N,N'-diacetylchitobiose transport system permease protein
LVAARSLALARSHHREGVPVSTRRLKRIGLNTAGAVVALVALFPVYWMVLSSFKRNSQLRTLNPEFLPTSPTLDNYRRVFEREFFWTAVRNSMLVTSTVVFFALVIAFFAAVALSRFRFRGRKAFLIAVLAIQMVPAEALIISLFRVLNGWELTNRIIGLSLTYLVFVLPFTIWTLRGFVGGVPLELEDAARVDGATRLGAFMRVTLPLIAPGLVATGIFAFILAWNEFIFALVLMDRPESQTGPVWLNAFNDGARGTDWGGVMAGSTLLAIPVVIFFLIVQRRVTAGLTAGAVKG